MMRHQRVYSPAEANHVLPQVRDIAARISELTQMLPELQEQVRTAEYLRGRPGSGGAELDRLERSLEALRDTEIELSRAALALEAMGIVLKDPAAGLVDFPALMDGELVELCWKLGEERVAHWHRLGEGFRGRKPL